MTYTNLIPVIKFKQPKKDQFSQDINTAYRIRFITSISVSNTTDQNETCVRNDLLYFFTNFYDKLFSTGSATATKLELVLRMFAFCQVVSYNLNVGVYKPELMISACVAISIITPKDAYKVLDVINVIESFDPLFVFNNHSAYLRNYLDCIGII